MGVVFDQELRWKQHVQQAIKRATKVNIALGGLRQLRPEQMRQLYEACVTPVLDYASTVWHDPLRDKTHLRHLRSVQRTALTRILSAFRTVATSTLEVEAHILDTVTEQEKWAFEKMIRSMLVFRPNERATAEQVLHSEWMKGWGQPALEESRALLNQ